MISHRALSNNKPLNRLNRRYFLVQSGQDKILKIRSTLQPERTVPLGASGRKPWGRLKCLGAEGTDDLRPTTFPLKKKYW